MTPITVLKDNVPAGPFTREQIADKLRLGEITLNDLAFIDGLSQWTPLREVLAKIDGPGAVTAPPPVMATLVSTPAPAPAYSYAATMQPPGHLVYAGFWLRVVAIIIDGLILSPLAIISAVLNLGAKHATDSNNPGAMVGVGLILIAFGFFAIIVRWLYFALLESSSWQATVGKKVMGLRVTNLEGNRIGFGQATGRFFAKILSAIILCIGFIMAGFTERKQALHDMIASTLVVRQ